MQRARLTEKIKRRASDDCRLAAATILAGSVSSPSRKEILSNVQLVLSLGVPAGSSSRLAKSATENRVEARDGKYSKFLGQANSKTKTRKLSNEEWQELREEYIPNLECVSDTPCKGSMIIKGDMHRKLSSVCSTFWS